MLTTETPAGLIDAINEGNSLALAALADHFGEQGDEVAEEAIRWCIAAERNPRKTISDSYTGKVYYWRLDSGIKMTVPRRLLEAMSPTTTHPKCVGAYRDFPTIYEAYIGLVEGWRKLTPLERQQVKEMRL